MCLIKTFTKFDYNIMLMYMVYIIICNIITQKNIC